MDLGGWEGGYDLGGLWGGETTVRIYFMEKNLLNR